MKTALRTAQILWGVFFSITGFGKILWYKPALWNQALHEVPWLSAVPQDLIIFIGVCEFLGGGPDPAGGHRSQTEAHADCRHWPDAGHDPRGCLSHRAERVQLCAHQCGAGRVAAFIAYGRLFVRPIAPASIGAFRVLKGLAVLGALVLVDFAPV